LDKTADRVPDNYERGELLVDTAMDLETNATTVAPDAGQQSAQVMLVALLLLLVRHRAVT
jgi:hypothetical protein